MNSDAIIYVVDDNADARDSAVALISEMGLKSESFSTAEEFLRNYDGHRPGCVLTDHRMLGITGIELLEELRENGVSLSAIVMTAYAETELTVRAMRSGAVTLLEKPFKDRALWEALRAALAEDDAHYQSEARKLRIVKRIDSLTSAEMDVLKLVIKGEPNKAVAAQLEVSVRTVENRRSAIFEKMDAHSVAELVRITMIGRPDLG